MRLKNLDLIVAMLIAALSVGYVLLLDRPPAIGVILALPLVFFLPGYTFSEVLFYNRPPKISSRIIRVPKLKIEHPLNTLDRFVLSLGLSVTIVLISGFILNILPMGLRPQSWAVFLALITTVFSLLAVFLRRRTPISAHRIVVPRFRISIYECILFGLAITVALLSILYSNTSEKQVPQSGFTQLWVLPSNQANTSCAVSIGVHSFESASVTFRAVMKTNGTQVTTWSPIVLAPQGEWDQVVSIKPDASSSMDIEVQLYRVDIPGIMYRDVHLTLHSLKSSKNMPRQQCTT